MAIPSPQSGKITFLDGQGNLEALEITSPWSRAEIYLHGAHVTQFQKHGEPPLLFLSQCSRFAEGQPIRGGIPIIFPWFGKPADQPAQHGFARNRSWTLKEITTAETGIATARLRLPPSPELGDGAITVEYTVTISNTLSAELIITNKSARAYNFENCLHTYFAVGDIQAVRVVGLQGVDYLDSLDGHQRKTEKSDAIHFAGEVDRTYVNTAHPVEVRDAALHRVIRVEKSGSTSTVVWNPWIAKATAMTDFGDTEYRHMVCVESGNVAENRITLAPGATTSLKVKLSSDTSP